MAGPARPHATPMSLSHTVILLRSDLDEVGQGPESMFSIPEIFSVTGFQTKKNWSQCTDKRSSY